MSQPFQTFDYMKKFACTGADCEDTCCSGWQVHLYRKDYEKIKALLDKDQKLAPYRDSMKRHPRDERGSDNYGVLNFAAGGHCALMDQGWCILHRDHGEKMLPTVCATFPRLIYELPSGTEVHGRLSCPEVARLCLLAASPARLEDSSASILPKVFETNSWASEKGGFFKQHLETVNTCLRTLMARDNFSIVARNYFVLYLGVKLQPFLYMDVEKDPAQRLKRILARMLDPQFLHHLVDNLTKVSLSDAKVGELILAIVNARLTGSHFDRYNALCSLIFRSYGEGEDWLATKGTLDPQLPTALLWQTFLARRALINERYAQRINRYFNNFCINFWSQCLFIGDSDLMTPCRKLLLYWAVTRFLFYSHPDVLAAAQADLPDAEAAPILDRAVVEVVQIFMKNIDANTKMLQSLLDSMDALGFSSLTHYTAMLHI